MSLVGLKQVLFGADAVVLGCIDIKGQSIPHGLLFAPGPDECQVKWQIGIFGCFRVCGV